MAIEFTSENFDAEVLKSDIPVLVDFWAPWCGPCKMLGPVIEDLAAEYNGKVKIGKVNVDNERELAISYGVSSIPSLKFFKNGSVVKESVGFLAADRIRDMINN
ncbi:MAG: thioredoxin [Spirochaetia bacterium]|nr:thioredoxin [Spirochaetia bacterium]